MGGTYWNREAPQLPPFVEPGSHFEKGQPLYIIEVMKMFNKVYAPFSGTIAKVLVTADGSIISKGQPIFKIVPDETVVEVSAEEVAARRRAATQHFLQQL
jgi:biotin carboxyl carrier protein